MLYEIVNPSDAYTLRADSDAVAAAAIGLLGNGQYDIDAEDDHEVPGGMLALTGTQAFAEAYGEEFGAFVDSHIAEIADALESVVIGNFGDRAEYEQVLSLIEGPEKQAEYRDKRHDLRRSSMNDIGGRALLYADRLRNKLH